MRARNSHLFLFGRNELEMILSEVLFQVCLEPVSMEMGDRMWRQWPVLGPSHTALAVLAAPSTFTALSPPRSSQPSPAIASLSSRFTHISMHVKPPYLFSLILFFFDIFQLYFSYLIPYRHTLLDFTLLHFMNSVGFCFYTLKARLSISKKITTCFVALLALLQWSGTEPAISLRCACILLNEITWALGARAVESNNENPSSLTFKMSLHHSVPQLSSLYSGKTNSFYILGLLSRSNEIYKYLAGTREIATV